MTRTETEYEQIKNSLLVQTGNVWASNLEVLKLFLYIADRLQIALFSEVLRVLT